MLVVILECKKIIVVPNNWVEKQNTNSDDSTKIFFSPDTNDEADFDLPKKMFFDKTERKCYRGYVLKECGKQFFCSFLYKLRLEKIIL